MRSPARLRSGRLHRLHRGVYAVGHRISHLARPLPMRLFSPARRMRSPATPRRRGSGDCSQAGPGSFHIDGANSTSSERRACTCITRDLTEEDRADRDGIPVTAVPRTLLDHAAISSGRSPSRRAIERSEERGLFDLRAVETLLGARRRSRRRGQPAPRHWPSTATQPGFHPLPPRAPLPSVWWKSAGLADALDELQRVAGTSWTPTGRTERFAVELDVYETHGSRAAFERDRLRQEDLKLTGIEMIRVTGPRLAREPDAGDPSQTASRKLSLGAEAPACAFATTGRRRVPHIRSTGDADIDASRDMDSIGSAR